MKKKKVLMLGGSHFQTPSIIRAKEMGFYVISCDYLPGNPGHKYSDKFINVSTIDKEEVLKVAKREKIDGIVCYASDPSATTAAYVCEKMEFPTNPYKSVEILSNKDIFRDFLRKNKFFVPKAKGYESLEDAKKEFSSFKMPVMLKPTDSSGSKGVYKINNINALSESFNDAMTYSRSKKIIIEEYVEKSGYQIAGDGFSVNGKLVFRCFANEHFEKSGINPFVPIGESWPYNMPNEIHQKVHDEIQRLLTLLKMNTGAYNFDIRIDNNNNIYIMELGPRNGGNLIPQVTKYATGVDMVEYTIKSAMGLDCSDLVMKDVEGYWSCYMVHSNQSGIFNKVRLKKEIKNNIVEFEMFYKNGDLINSFTGSGGTLGTMILKFNSMNEMLNKMDNMAKFIQLIIE